MPLNTRTPRSVVPETAPPSTLTTSEAAKVAIDNPTSAAAASAIRITSSRLRGAARRLPVRIEEVDDGGDVRRDDVAVDSAGHLDIFVLSAELLQLRDHRARSRDV